MQLKINGQQIYLRQQIYPRRGKSSEIFNSMRRVVAKDVQAANKRTPMQHRVDLADTSFVLWDVFHTDDDP